MSSIKVLPLEHWQKERTNSLFKNRIEENTPTGTKCKGVYALVWIIERAGVLITEYRTWLVLFTGKL